MEKKVGLLLTQSVAGLNNNRDLEELVINDIWIGDLVYDTYLARSKESTVDCNSQFFLIQLEDAVRTLVFWCDYFGWRAIFRLKAGDFIAFLVPGVASKLPGVAESLV